MKFICPGRLFSSRWGMMPTHVNRFQTKFRSLTNNLVNAAVVTGKLKWYLMQEKVIIVVTFLSA